MGIINKYIKNEVYKVKKYFAPITSTHFYNISY